MKRILVFALALITGPVQATDEWPQFRGPDGQGRTAATNLPLSWNEEQNVAWKTELPGEGHSSPVVSDNQIWLTTAVAETLTEEEEERRLAEIKNSRGLKLAGALSLQALLVDASSGRLLSATTLFEVPEPEPKHSLNSYASPTPAIAGDHVYFHFGTYGTACVHRGSGRVLWKQEQLHCDHQNGPGSSPVVWDDLLILHFDGIDQQYVVALDRLSGEVRWRTDRSGEMDPKPELQKAYGTALIVQAGGRPIVVSTGANWVYGYDARNGSEVWKAHYGKLGFSTVPRPVADDQYVYLSTSYMQPRLLAVDYTGTGDVTKTHVRWTSDRQAPRKPSMLLIKNNLYSVTDNGIAVCLQADTGEEIWKHRLSGDFSASPLYAEDRIYYFGQNGTTTVLSAAAEPTELAKNTLDAGFMASAAVVDEALILRTEKALYRIQQVEAGK